MEGIRADHGSNLAVEHSGRLPLSATALVICLLLGIGLGLRTLKLSDGLPRLYNPDEGLLALPALHIAQSSNLNPGRFEYGSLAIYILAGADRLASAVGILPDLRLLPDYDLTVRNITYPQPVLFAFDRLVMAVVSLLAVVAVFGVTQRLAGQRPALFAAGWMAISPLSVTMTRGVTTDALVQALVACTMWAALWVYERPTWTRSVLAGALAGAAASAKYPGVLSVVPLLLAVLWTRARPRRWRLCFGILAGAAGGFLLTTPYAVLDAPAFLAAVAGQAHDHGVQARNYVEGPSPLYYGRSLLTSGDGVMTLLSLCGFVLIGRRWPREAIILASFPVLLYVMISDGSPRAVRYLLPMIPFLAVCAGYAVHIIVGRLNIWHRWLGAIFVVVAFALPLLGLSKTFHTLYQPDIRDLTAVWVKENARGVPIATDPYGLPPDAAVGPYVVYGNIVDLPTQWYIDNGYWIILSDLRRQDANRTWEQQARLDALDADPNLEFVTHIDGQIGGLSDSGVTVLRPKRP
ncbi:MAG: glycosyltransferase family 39 protein [Anaerolineae bacterium]